MANIARWRDLRIGLGASIALPVASLAVLLLARVGTIRGETIPIYLRVSSARGLMKGSEVWIGGKKVGRVANIRFLPPAGKDADALLIELEVLERYRGAIRRDSPAEIRPGARLI